MTMQDYLSNARQCLSWALRANSEENRDAFLDVARAWMTAAYRLQQRKLTTAS
jgi:hypothetical protein